MPYDYRNRHDIVKALRWCSKTQCGKKCPRYGNGIIDIADCVCGSMHDAANRLELDEYEKKRKNPVNE